MITFNLNTCISNSAAYEYISYEVSQVTVLLHKSIVIIFFYKDSNAWHKVQMNIKKDNLNHA